MTTAIPIGLAVLLALATLGLVLDILDEQMRRRAAVEGAAIPGVAAPGGPPPRHDAGGRRRAGPRAAPRSGRPARQGSGVYRVQYGASAAYLPEGHQFAAEFSETDFVRLDIVDPSPPDYYALLDLSPTATREEIESAFRRHVVAVHPDRFFGDPVRYAESIVRLKELNEAMAVLRDPFTRSLYDIKYRSYQAASSPRRSGLLGRMAAS